jgi:hypothetical protein
MRLTTTGRRAAACAGLAKHAVDAHADDEAGLVRLDMDIGDAAAGGFGDDAVDQADGGRVVLAVEQVLGGGKVGGEAGEIVAEAERARRVGRGLAVHGIGFGEDAVEGGAASARPSGAAEEAATSISALGSAPSRRRRWRAVRLAQGGDAEALGERVRDSRGGAGRRRAPPPAP